MWDIEKEVLKRKKNARSQIEELRKKNTGLSNKVQVLETWQVQLLKRSQALDRLTTLEEATR